MVSCNVCVLVLLRLQQPRWRAEVLQGHVTCQHQCDAGCDVQEEQPHQAQQPASAEQPLLFVNMSVLKGDEEMRRMFGRDIVQLRNQEDQAADLGEAAQYAPFIQSQAEAMHAARLGTLAAAARFVVSAFFMTRGNVLHDW